MRLRKYLLLFFTAAVFLRCNTIDAYEKTKTLPKQEWSSSNVLLFNFTVTDTVAYYNIYLVLRHTESYHFNNIWINFTSTLPNRKPQTQRLNVQLANNANGWLGTSMDDIIEQRALLFNQPLRLGAGAYTFSIQQLMREDPLQNVLNAGIRVEKVVQ